MSWTNFIEIQAYLGIAWAIYHFGLRNSNCYRFNRFYLLFASLLSCIIPFINFNTTEISSAIYSLPAFTVINEATDLSLVNSGLEINWLYIAYLLISMGIVAKILLEIPKALEGIAIDGKLSKVIVNPKVDGPHSFWNRLIVPQYPIEEAIEAHELSHIEQKHHLDLLFFHLLIVAFWINPFAWLLMKSAKFNHELLADRSVISTGVKNYEYQELLLSKMLKCNYPILSHSFINHNQVKQRIMMLTKNKSGKNALWQLLWALPLSLFIFAACNNKPAIEESVPVKTTAEQMPEYPGGQEALFAFMQENIKYPEAAKKDSTEGKVIVSFIIDKEGKVTESQVVKSVDPILDEAALEVINKMPNWQPAKDAGVVVPIKYHLPISFRLK